MNLSDPDTALGLLRIDGESTKQATEDGMHVVSPIEAELHLSQVAVAVLGELDGAVGATERGLDVADERVDRAELLVEHAGPAAAGDRVVVHGAHRGRHGEAAPRKMQVRPSAMCWRSTLRMFAV